MFRDGPAKYKWSKKDKIWCLDFIKDIKWMRDGVPLVLKTGGDFIFLIEIQVWLIQSFHGFDSEKSRFWASQFTDLGDRKISNFNH